MTSICCQCCRKCTLRIKALTKSDVSIFLVENNIRKESEFMAVAKQRQVEGLPDRHNFILKFFFRDLGRSQGYCLEIKRSTRQKKQNAKKLREWRLLRISFKDSVWRYGIPNSFKCAREVFKRNNTNSYVFANALSQSITIGRQVNMNIMLPGSTNCDKFFLLNPLELMLNCFVNTAIRKCPWVGLDECEVTYLNDFRWSVELIAWNYFLLSLEGQTVQLPRPKNQSAADMVIDRDNTLLFFATSSKRIEFVGKYNVCDEREYKKMDSRWRLFRFTTQIPKESTKVLPPCPRCYSTLVTYDMEA